MHSTAKAWERELEALHQRLGELFRRPEPRQRSLAYLKGLLGVLSGCWRGHVRWRDEEIEIALSRSPFSGRGHQLRCALVFPLSVELARHRGTALRARGDRDIRPEGSPVGTRRSDAGATNLARASLTGSKRRDASRVARGISTRCSSHCAASLTY